MVISYLLIVSPLIIIVIFKRDYEKMIEQVKVSVGSLFGKQQVTLLINDSAGRMVINGRRHILSLSGSLCPES